MEQFSWQLRGKGQHGASGKEALGPSMEKGKPGGWLSLSLLNRLNPDSHTDVGRRGNCIHLTSPPPDTLHLEREAHECDAAEIHVWMRLAEAAILSSIIFRPHELNPWMWSPWTWTAVLVLGSKSRVSGTSSGSMRAHLSGHTCHYSRPCPPALLGSDASLLPGYKLGTLHTALRVAQTLCVARGTCSRHPVSDWGMCTREGSPNK